jgi:hypothetical protein
MVREMLAPTLSVVATVESVDKQAGTLVAIGDRNEVDHYYTVRLLAALDHPARGLRAYPKVGSRVVLSTLYGIEEMTFVSQMSDIEEWELRLDNNVSLHLTPAGQVQLNGDGFGGLMKVQELQAQLNKTNAVVQALQTTLTTWVPTPGDGGAKLKLAVTAALAGKVVGNFSSLENPNVKHG